MAAFGGILRRRKRGIWIGLRVLGRQGVKRCVQVRSGPFLGKPFGEQAVDARRAPKLILRAHLPDQRAQLYLDLRAPSPRAQFPTPIAAKADPMPPHQRIRLDNRHDLQDRRKPSIHLEEEPAIIVRKLGPTPHLAPQNDQLMSEHRILRRKPALRLERRGQHGQKKPDQRDRRANLINSIAQ